MNVEECLVRVHDRLLLLLSVKEGDERCRAAGRQIKHIGLANAKKMRLPLETFRRSFLFWDRWTPNVGSNVSGRLSSHFQRWRLEKALQIMRYRGYGLSIADVISEGNIGLMQAVKRFDPAKGFKLATYATW